MGRLGIKEDEPIQSAMVSRALESAQEKIEGANFDSRKHVLGFDDVLNIQRSTIYARRRDVLMGSAEHVLSHAEEHLDAVGADASILTTKEAELGRDALVGAVRRLLLQAYDMFWIQHLETMDHLRNSVNLRSYGGRDPFIEFRKEGLKLFRDLENSLSRFVSEALPRLVAPSAQPTITVSVGNKKYERNDIVTITNGTETRQLKYKKAEELLAVGWRIVQ